VGNPPIRNSAIIRLRAAGLRRAGNHFCGKFILRKNTTWLCLAFALAAGAAAAQPELDAERCRVIANNPDLAIQHCTGAIESGKFSGQALAELHVSRGVEWAAKSDYDRAIADYDAAIRLDPKYRDAFHNRGTAWANKGDHDRAIADFDAALRLAPQDAATLHARGVEWMVKGDYSRAISDFDAALGFDPKVGDIHFSRGRARFYAADYPRAIEDFERAYKTQPSDYSALWLYLARKRGGVAGAEDLLEKDTRATRDGGWPAHVIALYVGQTDAETVLKAASPDPDPRRQAERRCEANFYVAQWFLLRNASERALALLQEAQRECPKNFLEYEGAVAELRRLQQR
jgi:lipoprotein NlpI